MKPIKDTNFNLGRYLAKGLYPLSLGIGLLISLCFPITYYLLEYKGCERTAAHYATKTADRIKEIVITSPKLWKYQIYSFTEIGRELSQDSDVISIHIHDAQGVLIPNFHYNIQTEAEAKVWWNRWAPKGTADILFNNEKIGLVEIQLSQKFVLLKTALLLLVSATVGLALAFLSYHFPIRVVQRLEADLQDLFSSMQQTNKESDRLRHAAQESEKRFRGLVDGLDAIVWEADADTSKFTFISHQVENFFFIASDRWLTAADFFKDQIFPEDRERVLEVYRRSVEQEVDCQLEYRRVRKDGTIVWVQDNFKCIIAENEQKKQLRGVMVDVSKKKHDEDALKKLNRELHNLVETLEQRNLEVSTFHEISEMFQLCRDREEAYRIIGVAAQKLFPQDSGAFYILDTSRNMLDLTFAWGEEAQHKSFFPPDSCWALRRGRTPWTYSNHQLTCQNIGCETAQPCTCIPMLSQGETIGLFRLNITNTQGLDGAGKSDYETKFQLAICMTEHIAMAVANLSLRETLRYLSVRDPLTGLFNRRYMEETLLRELMLGERTKRKFGVIMMDLDHFKRFNDVHGHDAGDSVLREFGSFLLSNIREYDVACRYGGEEFICILPESTLENTLERAEELRRNLMSFSVEHLGRHLDSITVSAGVAVYPEHGTTEATIVKAADEALYRAKRSGRNRVVAAVIPGGKNLAEERSGHLRVVD